MYTVYSWDAIAERWVIECSFCDYRTASRWAAQFEGNSRTLRTIVRRSRA